MIDPRDIRTLRELIQWWRKVKTPLERILAKPKDQKRPRIISTNERVTPVKAPSGGIPARVGADPGKATCTVLTTNDSDEIITTSETLEVYNQITTTVMENGERLGMAAIHSDGKWWAIVDDCKDTGTG